MPFSVQTLGGQSPAAYLATPAADDGSSTSKVMNEDGQ